MKRITPEEMIGQRFGRWIVLENHPRRAKHGCRYWLCRCDCGTEKPVNQGLLRQGQSLSCGCLLKEWIATHKTIHGHTQDGRPTKEYTAWQQMIKRCYSPKHNRYQHYGARGISVQESWRLCFTTFLHDIGPAPSSKHSLGRLNNDLPYEYGNVAWQTPIEQARNKSTTLRVFWEGKFWALADLAERYGKDLRTLSQRLHKLHWPLEKALTTPVRQASKPQ